MRDLWRAFSWHNLVGAKRKEFLDMVKSNGLVISALCGDLGKASTILQRIRADRGVEADLRPAKELETNVVTTHNGVAVPFDPANERYQTVRHAFKLAQYADSWMHILQLKQDRRVCSSEKRSWMVWWHSTPGVAVNMDPATSSW